MTSTTWKHKDEWKREGKNHAVVVSRHSNYDGTEHRWCVYLYVYPKHKAFSLMSADNRSEYGFSCHSYLSLFRAHVNEKGAIGSFQLGWDYSHDGDSRYNEMATKDDAGSVFWDADRLFDEACERDK